MAYVKKMGEKEFVRLLVNKELEIAGGPTFETFEEMVGWSKKNPDWFSDYSFKTIEQFKEWRDYFDKHFYDCFTKHTTNRWKNRYLSDFCLMYGLKFDFEHDYRPFYEL